MTLVVKMLSRYRDWEAKFKPVQDVLEDLSEGWPSPPAVV